MAIDFTFNDEQQLIQNTAREFFARRFPPSVARRYEGSEEEFPHDLWQEMAGLGWLGMTFPEAYEGLACSALDVYGLYVELGRTLAPVPLLEAVAIGGGLVARLGSDAQKSALLPRIAAGEALLTLAITEADGLHGPEGITLEARAAGGGHALNGVKLLVPYVASAERLIVAARTGRGTGEAGVSLFLVDPKGAGVGIERLRNMGGYPLYAVTFDGAPGELLGPLDQAWEPLHEVLQAAAVFQSAMVVGAGERILEMTVGYAKERVQFGQPIGKHQAVQYLCTDVALQGHLTRVLALKAAWRIASGQPFLRDASLAKAQASKAAAAMTFAAHEVHAGVGFMNDYDLRLYTVRAKHWEYNLGDRGHHLDLAARQTEQITFV